MDIKIIQNEIFSDFANSSYSFSEFYRSVSLFLKK